MNEADIIKALEELGETAINTTDFQMIDVASMKTLGGILKATIDLINRKNAEIEKLTINMNAFGLTAIREKERADTARAEAIKEFVERVKGVYSAPRYERPTAHTLIIKLFDNIDQIAKEMRVE